MANYDYRTKWVKPQRGMSWTKAVQFMLHTSKNVVTDGRYYFRINDGVIEYQCPEWNNWPHMSCRWGTAAGHHFYNRWNKELKFDAVDLPPAPEEEHLTSPETAMLLDRIEELEQKIADKEKP